MSATEQKYISSYSDPTEAWLEELAWKQRSELSTLQVETLLFLAKQVRLSHAERLWMMTSALVRSAMTIGLHQKADYFV